MVIKLRFKMNNYVLSVNVDIVDGIVYIVSLKAKMTYHKYWKFIVDVVYPLNGVEVSAKLPFRVFDELRRNLIQMDGLTKFTHKDLSYTILSDGGIEINYGGMNYYWPHDLLKIVKESKYMEAFGRVLRKCNIMYEGKLAEKIYGWKDNDELSTVVSNVEQHTFGLDRYHMKNGDKYSLDIVARTSDELERWYPRIKIYLESKEKSRPHGLMDLSILDFLALRNYLIQFEKTGDYQELYLGKIQPNVTAEFENEKVTKLVVSYGESSFTLYKEFISFIVKGNFMTHLALLLRRLNYEMEPPSFLKYWFFKGAMILDEGAIRERSLMRV